MDTRKIQIRLYPDDVQMLADALETSEYTETAHAQRERALRLAAYLTWRVAKFGDHADPDPRRHHPAEV